MRHELGDLPRLFEDEALDSVGSIVEAEADHDAARLSLLLRVAGFGGSDERRIIDCRNAIRWVLTDDTIYWFNVHEDHPALLSFTDEQADLYFTGTPSDPARTVDALRGAAARVAGCYLNFDATVNSGTGGLAKVFGGGYGKVASGPMTLLHAYEAVLEPEGVKTSVLGTGEAKMYVERDMRWVPVPKQLSVLELGESWIVAQSFHCRPA